MTYTEQIEQQLTVYPQAVAVYVPSYTGVTTLPDTHVDVHVWEEDFCELLDASGVGIARFKLVG